MTLTDRAEVLSRRDLRPDSFTECECGRWVSHDHAFLCDDGPTLCRECSPTADDIARQKRSRK